MFKLLPSAIWLSLLLLVCVLGASCVKTMPTWGQLSMNRFSPSGMTEDGRIVVFLESFSGKFSPGKEAEFVGCVGDSIRKANPALGIVQPDDFRRAVAPDLTHREIPSAMWGQLIQRPNFQEQVALIGARYLVLISGDTQQTVEKKVADSYGLVGELYYRESWLKASVWDIVKAQMMGDISVRVSGRPSFEVFFVIFGWAVAYTETRACNELGKALQKFLAGETLSEMVLPPEK